MRVLRTLLAFAALLLVTACSAQHVEIALPDNIPAHDSGTWIGSGNAVASDTTAPPVSATERGGAGLIGSGNSVAPDTTQPASASADRGGLGLMGSGNSVASDTTAPPVSATERGGIGLLGSGN